MSNNEAMREEIKKLEKVHKIAHQDTTWFDNDELVNYLDYLRSK